jgi:hypothetical protein
MKRTSGIFRASITSGHAGVIPGRLSSIFQVISFYNLGVCFLVLVVLTVRFYQVYIATKDSYYGFLAFLSGALATIALIGLSTLLALGFRHVTNAPSRVIAALITTLKRDDDPRVRAKAAEGLAELDAEESLHHFKHKELDEVLISSLKDTDPRVRAKVAEGLAYVEVEDLHNDLDDVLFGDG